MLKKFLDWIKLKEKLHEIASDAPIVKERDLWWVSFGENVGSEMNGKSELFSRSALIIKKLSRGFFLVAPTTSMPHQGSWYVKIKHAGKDTFVCLHQIRTIDYRRLSSQLGQIDENDFEAVKKAFHHLYK